MNKKIEFNLAIKDTIDVLKDIVEQAGYTYFKSIDDPKYKSIIVKEEVRGIPNSLYDFTKAIIKSTDIDFCPMELRNGKICSRIYNNDFLFVVTYHDESYYFYPYSNTGSNNYYVSPARTIKKYHLEFRYEKVK